MNSKGRDEDQPQVLCVLKSRNETRAFHDKISRVYDLLAEHSEEPIRRTGIGKLAAQVGERILEIGFGTGHCLVEFARTVGLAGRVYGVDLSEGMLGQARDLLRREQLDARVEIQRADATVSLTAPR